ncbi:unnamed protein product [Absidia cylindrospora]
MDKAARKKLNLKAIKRYDAAIVNILDQSPHAVLYYFSNERRKWVKKSVEGVLFLVQRNAPPYFAVYIMNRLAMENYTLYLTNFDDMDLQENFIIYSTSDGEQYAFWLYEEGDRQRLLNKITTLHDGIQKELSAKTNQKNPMNSTMWLCQYHLHLILLQLLNHHQQLHLERQQLIYWPCYKAGRFHSLHHHLLYPIQLLLHPPQLAIITHQTNMVLKEQNNNSP